MAGPPPANAARIGAVRQGAGAHAHTVHAPSGRMGFDLPGLLYTTLAVAFGLFALGRLLGVVVLVRDAPEVTMAVMADALVRLGAIAAAAALVFGGCFGRGLPGWSRVTLACVGAVLLAGGFAAL